MADRPTIDDLLAEARSTLAPRVSAEGLADVMAREGMVVDIRPIEQRRRDGELPGVLLVDRNVFEWRLDPASPHKLSAIQHHDHEIVVVCNEGYASSLAAATLQRLGFHWATDLDGGFQAWRRVQD